MDAQDKALFMQEAQKAFHDEKVASGVCLLHAQTCWVCRARRWNFDKIIQWFMSCPKVKKLAYDAAVAKGWADQFRLGLEDRARSLYAEIEALETPSLQWLDGLYALRDDREE